MTDIVARVDAPVEQEETRRLVEQAARASYGRLIAFLSARSGNVALAEDALADAFRAALETWPRSGAPAKPEAWLLTAARRRLIDGARHEKVVGLATTELLSLTEEAAEMAETQASFPDERLKLMFICAHPAIDAAARTPLMLQTVLGLDAARIASAFLIQPAAMGQRLARAKAKIRDARIGFALPQPRDLQERLEAVVEAIYAAYGSGWDDIAGADPRRNGLAAEALDLGGLLIQLCPEPEAKGLLALMLHCEARRPARRGSRGEYVPLTEQDVTLWQQPMIDRADALLADAAGVRRIGRFQLEAAIQSVHAQRRISGITEWPIIAMLYEGLIRHAPTIGALVGRAAAVVEAHGAEAGMPLLAEIPREAVERYQPYWALAAHLHRKLGNAAEAASAMERAIGLCEEPAVREFLTRKLN